MLLTTPSVMFESKQNSNSNCSSEGRYRLNPKKYSQPPKKVQLGFNGFCPYFLLLTTPYVTFESKQNSDSNCSSEGRYRLNPKKFPQPAKKVPYGLERFVRVFGKLTTPSVMFLKQKTQILIAHQKEDIDRTKKSTACRQKKFPQGLQRFVRVFGKLTTAYVMFEIKFLLNSQIEPKKVPLGFRAFRTCFWEVDHPLCDV